MTPAILIPIFYVHHILALFGPRRFKTPTLSFGYLFGLIFALISFNPLFVKNVRPKLAFPYWPNPGPLYHVFLFIWLIFVAWSIYIILFDFFRASGRERDQLRYVLVATIIGWSGGITNFPLWYDVPIPPIGNFLVSGYVALTAYAIVRYRLMDINVAVTRTGILLGVYALVIGLPIGVAVVLQEPLKILLRDRWWTVPVVFYTVLATGGPFAYLFLQRKAEDRLLREQRRYQRTLLNASKGMTRIKELNQLLTLIVHMLTKEVRVTHAGVFLVEEETGDYVLRAARGHEELAVGMRLPSNDVLVEHLRHTRDVIVHEELIARLGDQTPQAQQAPAGRALQHVSERLHHLQASLIVPSFTEDRLLGFLVLGGKRSGHIFSTDDLAVFATLANQSALAIENAMYFEELKTNQAYLVQSEKLASLGQLASGMAHEVHNPLTIISGESQLYLEQHRHDQGNGEMRKLLESIIHECSRAADITRRVLRFAKPAKDETGSVDLVVLVQDTLTLVSYQVRMTNLTVENRLAGPLPPVCGNATQLQEVVLNLSVNACQAMGDRGTLTLTAGAVGPFVQLRIADTGPGIPASHLRKIFDPFFTTKQSGTGLGLFVTQRIIRSHGGTIEVESVVGQGTTFIINLPQASVGATPGNGSGAASAANT